MGNSVSVQQGSIAIGVSLLWLTLHYASTTSIRLAGLTHPMSMDTILVFAIADLAVCAVAAVIGSKYGQSLTNLPGWRGSVSLRHMFCGFLIAAGIHTLHFAVGEYTHQISIIGCTHGYPFMFFILVTGLNALAMELLFRGVLTTRLEFAFGSLPAILLSSLVASYAEYDYYRVGTPSTLHDLSVLGESYLMEILYAGAYLWSRSLWVCVGLDFGWRVLGAILYGYRPLPGALINAPVHADGTVNTVITTLSVVVIALMFIGVARTSDRWRHSQFA